MGCNCKVVETIIGIVVIVLAFWPTLLGDFSKWALVIAGGLLICHALMCSACAVPVSSGGVAKKAVAKRKGK
jgi:hypothetical protein